MIIRRIIWWPAPASRRRRPPRPASSSGRAHRRNLLGATQYAHHAGGCLLQPPAAAPRRSMHRIANIYIARTVLRISAWLAQWRPSPPAPPAASAGANQQAPRRRPTSADDAHLLCRQQSAGAEPLYSVATTVSPSLWKLSYHGETYTGSRVAGSKHEQVRPLRH